MDNFALLNAPRQPWLEADSLKAEFLRLAAQTHPDKAAAPEKATANQRYAELNAAYRCLLEPKDRLLHLLELELGAPPKDVQSIPPGMMDLLMEIGKICRETDAFLQARAKTTSPLLKVQLFETGMAWTGKLTQLRQQIDARRDELLQELKTMNASWPGIKPLDRLEQIYRVFGYMARWTAQIQERLVQLSF
jgi:curved DNA-binding protein CbpA